MGLCVLLLACKRLLLHWRVRKACQKGNYDVAEFLLNWCYTVNEPLLLIMVLTVDLIINLFSCQCNLIVVLFTYL